MTGEAILLMYLADELGADERREVEQMLVVDAALAGGAGRKIMLGTGCCDVGDGGDG